MTLLTLKVPCPFSLTLFEMLLEICHWWRIKSFSKLNKNCYIVVIFKMANKTSNEFFGLSNERTVCRQISIYFYTSRIH